MQHKNKPSRAFTESKSQLFETLRTLNPIAPTHPFTLDIAQNQYPLSEPTNNKSKCNHHKDYSSPNQTLTIRSYYSYHLLKRRLINHYGGIWLLSQDRKTDSMGIEEIENMSPCTSCFESTVQNCPRKIDLFYVLVCLFNQIRLYLFCICILYLEILTTYSCLSKKQLQNFPYT